MEGTNYGLLQTLKISRQSTKDSRSRKCNGTLIKDAVMGDLATRYDMMFEDCETRYIYVHECCRTGGKLTKIVNEYENRGYKLVYHIMSDLATRHEFFFEKEVK